MSRWFLLKCSRVGKKKTGMNFLTTHVNQRIHSSLMGRNEME